MAEPDLKQIEAWVDDIHSADEHIGYARQGNPDIDEWMALGACTDEEVDNSIFLERTPKNVQAAKAICAQCVVQEPCLEYALKYYSDPERTDHMDTVWGGKTGKQRLTILKQRAKEAKN